MPHRVSPWGEDRIFCSARRIEAEKASSTCSKDVSSEVTCAVIDGLLRVGLAKTRKPWSRLIATLRQSSKLPTSPACSLREFA